MLFVLFLFHFLTRQKTHWDQDLFHEGGRYQHTSKGKRQNNSNHQICMKCRNYASICTITKGKSRGGDPACVQGLTDKHRVIPVDSRITDTRFTLQVLPVTATSTVALGFIRGLWTTRRGPGVHRWTHSKHTHAHTHTVYITCIPLRSPPTAPRGCLLLFCLTCACVHVSRRLSASMSLSPVKPFQVASSFHLQQLGLLSSCGGFSTNQNLQHSHRRLTGWTTTTVASQTRISDGRQLKSVDASPFFFY